MDSDKAYRNYRRQLVSPLWSKHPVEAWQWKVDQSGGVIGINGFMRDGLVQLSVGMFNLAWVMLPFDKPVTNPTPHQIEAANQAVQAAVILAKSVQINGTLLEEHAARLTLDEFYRLLTSCNNRTMLVRLRLMVEHKLAALQNENH